MPYTDCNECGATFKWSENNHINNSKPDYCPECRDKTRVNKRQQEYSRDKE